MGLVCKPTITKYWCKNEMCNTPFFGQYMTRTQFEMILANIHIVDNTIPSQDPLNKIHPVLTMIDHNFMHVYTPKKNLSVDKASCPFKRRLGFKMYNPRKPAHFHIRLYQVYEADSGYYIGLEVFTGNKNSQCIQISRPLDPTFTITTKLVLGLLEKSRLLDKGHHIYTDNYYTSPELMEELYWHSTFSAGTCRSNRKGLPKVVTLAKLKPGQSCFHRNGTLLCIKWCDK